MDITLPLGLLLLLQDGGGGSLIGSLLPMILIFAIFYFLVIRPQQKRQRQTQLDRQQMLNSLKTGDKVITTGGIYGKIIAVRDDSITLKIADKVNIELQRSAIAERQGGETKEISAAEQV